MISASPSSRRSTARSNVHPSPVGARTAPGDIIPYDHGASFSIAGRPGNLAQDSINISPDGVFVAVAIGYGFEEERGRSLGLALPQPPTAISPGKITFGQVPPAAMIEGFRVNPRFELMTFKRPGAESAGTPGRVQDLVFSDQDIPPSLLSDDTQATLFQRVKRPEEISFLFSIVDTSTGRELQDEPTHNLASLGKGNGERPFRHLAHPIAFLPRSTIRLQIIERSEGVKGTLFIVLFGYKVIGSSVCPEPVMRMLTGPAAYPLETIGQPSDRVIPFDYVTTVELSGRPGNFAEGETTVNTEGGFVATSLGYGLLPPETRVVVNKAGLDQNNPLDLSTLPLSIFSPSALLEGTRLRPQMLRIAFDNNGQLSGGMPIALLDELFERLNRPEDVSFRYSIFDTGRGRDLQNQPLHNIAGLGIANGDRPFKRLARPMLFLPRSTIRIQVEEKFGRGTLFFVMQGYKILKTPLMGMRA